MIRSAEYYRQVPPYTYELASDAAFLPNKAAIQARQQAIRDGRLIVVASLDDIPGDDPTNPDGCVGCSFIGPQYVKTLVMNSHSANGGWSYPPTSSSFDPTNTVGMYGWRGGPDAWKLMTDGAFHDYPGAFKVDPMPLFPTGSTFDLRGGGNTLSIWAKEPQVLKANDGECEKPSPGATCQEKIGCEVTVRYRFGVMWNPAKYDGSIPDIVVNSPAFGLSNQTMTYGNDSEVSSGTAWFTISTTIDHTLSCGDVFIQCISPFALVGQGGFTFTVPSIPSLSRAQFDSENTIPNEAYWIRLICQDCQGT